MFDYHIGYVFHQDHNENSPDPGGALKTVPQKCKVEPISMNIYIYIIIYLVGGLEHFFPTCQVRVVRFYQSCSPPPRLAILLLVLLLLRQHLLHHLCLHFHVHCCQCPSSVCTAGPQPQTFPAQWAPLDLNLGPSQLSGHRWTSTWGLPSSVCTAGPQPGTFPAQCAPLDLNLGPSQLSVHCWNSTWDLPSSVCTAGPQRPDRMPEDMPDRMSDRMPEDMPDKMP